MIAKKNWFQRRKYGGWGITPKTWQGWVYILIIIGILIVFQSMPFWSNQIRIYGTIIWISFLLIDVSHIMITLNKDERESKIEAIAERNAAWFMIMILVFAVLFDVYQSAIANKLIVNWFVVVALIGGTIVKTVSNLYLERKKL
jgi:hypothetical protein